VGAAGVVEAGLVEGVVDGEVGLVAGAAAGGTPNAGAPVRPILKFTNDHHHQQTCIIFTSCLFNIKHRITGKMAFHITYKNKMVRHSALIFAYFNLKLIKKLIKEGEN